MYKYYDITQMQEAAGKMSSSIDMMTIGDFYRTGIEIYVGSFPDVSGPDLVIDPHDHKSIELFKEFAGKLAEHYKTLKNPNYEYSNERGRDEFNAGTN